MIELSDEDIFAAADAVLASGRSVTPARVRAQLGRGSSQRIGALLDQWLTHLLGPVPGDALPVTLNQALGQLWEQATTQGRQGAEQAFARQRQAWVEDRCVMEKAFAKQRQAPEQRLSKERQVFAEQRQRLLRSNERMRERLRQARESVKGAKIAVRVAVNNLDKTQRQLAFAQAVDTQHRRHDHEQAVELRAVYRELFSRPLPVIETPVVSAPAPEGAGGNLWRDFTPLQAAQHMLGSRLDELRRPLSAASGPALELRSAERDRYLGQVRVIEQLLDELRHQAMAYREAVDELFVEFMPLYLAVRQP